MIADNRNILFTTPVSDLGRSPELLADWQTVLAKYPHINALYASPEWACHLSDESATDAHVLFVRDAEGQTIGAVPLRLRAFDLQFEVAKSRLLRTTMQVIEVLGSIPLLPPSAVIHRRVFESIFGEFPKCSGILFDSVPLDCYVWEFLQGRAAPAKSSYLHIADGPRPWHLLRLSSSFDQYMMSLSSKARANMRREVRQLADRLGGQLKASRIQEPEQIPLFLEKAARVSRCSWQARALGERVGDGAASIRQFQSLARRGLLRAYLLEGGETACAFVVGYQHMDVYHYVEVAYDEVLSEYSPGKVLLTLMLEDLHAFQPPAHVNFGVGDASYKRRFGNLERADAGCLILRNHVSNRIATAGHSFFNTAVNTAKWIIGRKVTK